MVAASTLTKQQQDAEAFGKALLATESYREGVKGLVAEALKNAPAQRGASEATRVLSGLSNAHQSAYMGPDGMPHVLPHSRLGRQKHLGYRQKVCPITGRAEKGLYFSGGPAPDYRDSYLQLMHDYTNPRTDLVGPKRKQECQEKLTEMGVYKTWQDKGGAVFKAALAESSGVAGGYTVPTIFAEVLMTIAAEATVLDKYVTKMPLVSRNLLVPSLDIATAQSAGVSAFLGGMQVAWTAESALRSEFEPQFRQTEFTAWELAALCIASNTLLEDQAVQLDQFLTMLFGLTVGWFTEYAWLQGNGVGKPLGILNAGALLQVTREIASTVTYIDITNMWASLWTMLQNEASVLWLAHPSVYARILRLNDESGGTAGTNNQGRMLFVPINQGAQESVDHGKGPTHRGYLLGAPLYLSEKLPAQGTSNCLLLLDASKYIVAPRLEIVVDVSEHYKFGNNQTTWRIGYRGDGQPWLYSAITLADGTKTVSPFVSLTQ